MARDNFEAYARGACVCQRCQSQRLENKSLAERLTGYVMSLCPTCGNKRCPKGTDHDNECTRSNEPGQEGSQYR